VTKTRKKPAETRQETGRKPASGNRQPAAKKAKAKGKPAQRERTLTAWQKWAKDPDAAIDDLCDRVMSGESITAIAAKLGTSKPNLIRWVDADPDRSARAREARVQAAATYDDMALQGIEEASDPFELARAKEKAHHLRWRASKINPREYGDKIEMKQEVSFQNLTDEQINAELARINERLAGITGRGSGASSS